MELKYLNAINILATAKIGALQKIHDRFNGNWQKAWESDLTNFLPQPKKETGAPKIDYRQAKKSIDPDKGWEKLQKEKISLTTILDDGYPKLLREISDPPFLIYSKGDLGVAGLSCFAVVGTRTLSDYGKMVTPQLTSDVARAGFAIVSGLAEGIDTLAHRACLEQGQKTIAVLGSGIDERSLFPQRNLALARKIIENGGVLISEYAPGTHGSRFTFPQRNRIISGLSKGVLIIEADMISGALITARSALEQNRDVFAVPGNIFSKTSQGTNEIIKNGAKAVTCSADILSDYGIEIEKIEKRIIAANEIEEKILTFLTTSPVTANEIIRQTGIEPSTINATLMVMELEKKIKNLGDNRFVKFS